MILMPNSISPDNTVVFSQATGAGNQDLMTMRLNGERKAEPLIARPSSDMKGAVSPDGRWLAMQSIESGRSEIWLQSFPDVDSFREKVSTGGGSRPVWERSGRELFYMRASSGTEPVSMWAVPVQTSPSLVLGMPVKLFEGPYLGLPFVGRTYDVSPDGRRFLMIKSVSPAQATATQRIVIVENWTEELKRLFPTN
jgi:hypothetical protein